MAMLEIARTKREIVNKTEEYFNAIRTNIQLSGADIKVVGITSVQSNEGKSTTAASLAIAYARSDYKTVLVDADIRNSVMPGFFKANYKDYRFDGLPSRDNRLVSRIMRYRYSKLDRNWSQERFLPTLLPFYKVRILKIYLRLFVAIMIMLSLTVHH